MALIKKVKYKSRKLLYGNAGKDIAALTISFILRRGSLIFWLFTLPRLLRSNFFKDALSRGNDALIFSGVFAVAVIFLFFNILSAGAIKNGEYKYFFLRASDKPAPISTLFCFGRPRDAFRCLAFNFKLNFLKLFWTLFFIAPSFFCAVLIFYLYTFAPLSKAAAAILICGNILLLAASLFILEIAKNRYLPAIVLFVFTSLSAKEAIRRGAPLSDGFLKKINRLKISFAPLFASSLFLFPAFFVIPYYRLSLSLLALKTTEINIRSAYIKAP